MRFAVEVILFPTKFCRKIYFNGKFVTEFFSFCTLSHMLSWIDQFFFIENNFLHCLVKQECYSSSHFIFQYKIPPKECRQSVNYAINEIITQWLVINICLRTVVGRNISKYKYQSNNTWATIFVLIFISIVWL